MPFSSPVRSASVRSLRGLTALTLLGIAALGLAAHPAAAQGLSGQDVSFAFGVGDTAPTASYFTNLEKQTIPLTGVTYFDDDDSVNAFVTPNQIVLTSTQDGLFASDPFVGFRFAEVGTSPQTITGISLDPATNLPDFQADQLSFDANNIYVNFSGLDFSQGQNVTLNFTSVPSSAPVPEASTTVSLGLMLALGGLVFAVKRKKAHAA